jgi:hypothetical protein
VARIAFTSGEFFLLGLDDCENHKPESLSAAQQKFLETELRVRPDVPAFVFCHVPLMFDERLDMTYYDETRTACFEPQTSTREALQNRAAPVFWMSGHIHLRPDHYLFNAYTIAPCVAGALSRQLGLQPLGARANRAAASQRAVFAASGNFARKPHAHRARPQTPRGYWASGNCVVM